MAEPKKVAAALRRQIEAQERNDEKRDQRLAEFYASNPEAKRRSETPAHQAFLDKAAKELNESWKRYDIHPQIEGFVAGWLVGSGQFDEYRELLQIWLDTPKEIRESESVDVADLLASVSASPRAGRG